MSTPEPTAEGKILAMAGLSPERLAELTDQGFDAISLDFESIKLSDPAHDETVVGELTNHEANTFFRLYKAKEEFDTMGRVATGEAIKRFGDLIIKSDDPFDQKNGKITALAFATDDEEKRYCRLMLMIEYLRASLYYKLAERLGIPEYELGVRSKRRVVKKFKRIPST